MTIEKKPSIDASPFEEKVDKKQPQVSSKGIVPSRKVASISKSKPTTPYEVFNYCIERAENLIKIHQAAHGKRTKPEKYLADAHRAAIVLSISALDAFIRTFVIERIRQLLASKSKPLPSPLNDKIKNFVMRIVYLRQQERMIF